MQLVSNYLCIPAGYSKFAVWLYNKLDSIPSIYNRSEARLDEVKDSFSV